MFLFLSGLLVALLVIQYSKRILYWKRKGLPSPIPLPLLGIGIEFFTQTVTSVHFYREKKYGKIYGVWLGHFPMIIVNDAEFAKIVTQKEAQNFLDINPLKFQTKFFKDSFMFSKGQKWKNGRSLMTPVFTTRRIKDIFPSFQQASLPFFENIENAIKEGKQDEIDAKDLLKGYSLDVVAKFVFAIELNSAKDKDHRLVVAVKKLLKFNNSLKFILMTLLPTKLIQLLDLQFLDKKSLDYISDLCEFLVKQRRENKEVKYDDFLDLLIRTIDEKNLSLTQDQITSYAILFFFAGLETVTTACCNALYCLALNQDKQIKLYNELIDFYSNKEIEYDQLKESAYLDAVLKESQRIYPALNTIVRVAENPIEIKGVQVDAGQAVAIQILNLHYNADFWGEDVREFRPERFLDKNLKTETENEIYYLPFGNGPRSCVATRFAQIEVKYMIAKIILNYEVYRSEKTSVPPKYTKNPSSFTYEQMILGFRKREK